MICYIALSSFYTYATMTMIPHLTPITPWTPQQYNVTIGTPSRQMWKPIVQQHKQALNTFLQRFDYLHLPDVFFWSIQWWAQNLFTFQQFVKQIKALADVSGIRWGKLLFLNFMYQYSTSKACSGVLIRDGKGKILHGRNIDFQMFGMLSKLVVTVNFYQKQQIVYTGNYFVGSVFILTGIRHGAFGINLDTRKADNYYKVLYNILFNNGIPSSWLLTKTLQQQVSFHGAVKRLNQTHTTSPTYYVISGLNGNQGAVIQKDIHGAHGYYQLSNQTWFLVQTNYDRDIPDPAQDYRRTPAQHRISSIGQARFDEHLLSEQIMQVWPTFNIGTIFTSIIVPSKSHINTTIWYCKPKKQIVK